MKTATSATGCYITGHTESTNFPTASPLQAANGGGTDAFVAKLNAAGSALLYSTYLGGSGTDRGSGIAVDSAGNAYITGYTESTNFPTASPLQGANGGGGYDAFVAKLNPAGLALVYSTYLGGSGLDCGWGIAVDSAGNVYITGYTESTNFPTASPLQAAFGGVRDAFVAKVSATGSALLYSTYLGGSGNDYGFAIAVDSTGSAYVTGITGYTASTNFPTASPLQAANAGGMDVFVAKLSAAGSALPYSIYLGGSGDEYGNGIAVDSAGNAYIAGYTESTNFPTASPLQAANGGRRDAFIAKISGLAAACTYSIAPTAQSTGASGGTGSVTVTAPFGCTWTATSNATWITITSGASGSGNGTVGYSAAANRTNDVRTGNLTIAGLGFVVTQAASSLPMITSMSPTSAVVGGDSFVLTLKGHNFVTGSVVRWNQTSLPTTFVSTSELQALVSRANLTTAGNIAVTVSSPGSGTSDAFTFPLMYPPATLSLLVPSSLSLPGADSFVLTVKGGTFVAGSVIRWNGSDRPTVFLNSGELQALISASDAANPGTVSITVFHPLQVAGNALNFVICASCPQRFPSINASGIVNGASFNASVAGGSIASVFGTNLASSESFASSVPLPTTLGGGTVQINGIPAPLFYVSPAQINFQAPWELLGQSQASITVTVAGVTSTAQAINIAAFAPGLFAVNSQGTGQGAVLIAATGEIAAPLGSIAGRATRPVQRGEYLSIYCSGLGPVANQPVNGAASPANALPTTMNTPTVTIGGVTAIVSFSGLAPGFVALYQVNVQVPDNAPTGNAVSVVLTIGGATSNTVTVAVQ